jgi:spermidine/putrescine transport system ATP-binding protein
MDHGKVLQIGRPRELYERPANRFVADFIGTSNFMPATVEEIDAGSGRVTARNDRGLVLRGTLTDPAATVTAGMPVTVMTRPERLDVVPAESAADPGWVGVPGRINQGTYLGDQTEFRVQTDQAGELIVRRQNATGAAATQGLGPGDPVLVRWREEANLVLAG